MALLLLCWKASPPAAMTPAPPDTSIPTLGPCLFPSPLHRIGGVDAPFNVMFRHRAMRKRERGRRFTLIRIVTCGGLCPGLNDITRGLVNQCHPQYGISRVYGFRYGYEGLVSATPSYFAAAKTANASFVAGITPYSVIKPVTR